MDAVKQTCNACKVKGIHVKRGQHANAAAHLSRGQIAAAHLSRAAWEARSTTHAVMSAAAVHTPATAPQQDVRKHSVAVGERTKKAKLQLSLGPLPLIEQRFHVSTGVQDRFRAKWNSDTPPATASRLHPHEFVLVCPEDVDEVIDLYFEL